MGDMSAPLEASYTHHSPVPTAPGPYMLGVDEGAPRARAYACVRVLRGGGSGARAGARPARVRRRVLPGRVEGRA
jgi:hypothetical protein